MARTRYTARVHRIVKAMRAERAQPCRRCGQDIDYDAPPEDPNSFNAGHIKNWRNHPELREDPANFQPEHALCNKQAGMNDGGFGTGLGMNSRQW